MSIGRSRSLAVVWVGVVIAALVAAVVVAVRRAGWEAASRRVEVVVDFQEIDELCAATGTPVEAFVAECARRGVTAFAVRELTVESLGRSAMASVLSGDELLTLARLTRGLDPGLARLAATGEVHPGCTYLVVPTGAGAGAAELITERLESRASQAERHRVLRVRGDAGAGEPGLVVIEIMLGREDALGLTLGIPPETAKLLADHGLGIVPRFSNSGNMTGARMLGLLETCRPARVDCVVFDGEEVGGYPMAVASVGRALADSGVLFGDIEFASQKGSATLARLVAPSLARVHSITAGEMTKVSSREAVDRYARAVRERGIRVVYLRPFPPSSQPGADPVEYNLTYFGQVVQAVRAQGLEAGPLTRPAGFAPGVVALAVLALGAIAAGVMLLSAVVEISLVVQVGVFLLGGLVLAGMWLKGYGTLARQMTAFGAAVVFPTLAMTLLIKWMSAAPRGRFGPVRFAAWGLAALGATSCVSVTGGLLVAGLLSDHRFFLKVLQFLGVKAMHVLPPAAVVVLYWQFFMTGEEDGCVGNGGGRKPSLMLALKRLGREPIQVWHLVVLGLIGLAGLVYVLRTGNVTQVPVPVLEEQARLAVERALVVRPRTKEFLLGHPALVAAAAAALGAEAKTGSVRRWLRWLTLPLLVGASIGQLSMVNTFSHMHTPLVVTLIRTAYGIVLGGAIGFVAVLLAAAAAGRRCHRAGTDSTAGGGEPA